MQQRSNPEKNVLDHVGYTAPTRQHELDLTYQEYIFPEGSHEAGIDDLDHDLSEV